MLQMLDKQSEFKEGDLVMLGSRIMLSRGYTHDLGILTVAPPKGSILWCVHILDRCPTYLYTTEFMYVS